MVLAARVLILFPLLLGVCLGMPLQRANTICSFTLETCLCQESAGTDCCSSGHERSDIPAEPCCLSVDLGGSFPAPEPSPRLAAVEIEDVEWHSLFEEAVLAEAFLPSLAPQPPPPLVGTLRLVVLERFLV